MHLCAAVSRSLDSNLGLFGLEFVCSLLRDPPQSKDKDILLILNRL